MDHTATKKGPSSARVHKCLPYLAHQDGCQRFRATSGAQVSWFSSYIHPYQNGISGHLILGRGLLICHQNRAEAKIKDAKIWAQEPLTTKSMKGRPQTIEQRTKKRWAISGQLVQSPSKQGHRKYKEIYWEVV
jgi:hypothetical protein